MPTQDLPPTTLHSTCSPLTHTPALSESTCIRSPPGGAPERGPDALPWDAVLEPEVLGSVAFTPSATTLQRMGARQTIKYYYVRRQELAPLRA